MKLLMHICCANCGLYPIKTLTEKGVSIKGLWFNPNIHPYAEYNLRLNAVKKLELLLKNPPSPPFTKGGLGGLLDIQIHYFDFYGLKEFIQRTENGGADRCRICYTMRLDETARRASAMKLDGFTTSLLVSPYQKFDVIIDVGREMEKKYSVLFYEEDFRHGWKDSIKLSRELSLYRQRYCGCIYSEMERYLSANSL